MKFSELKSGDLLIMHRGRVIRYHLMLRLVEMRNNDGSVYCVLKSYCLNDNSTMLSIDGDFSDKLPTQDTPHGLWWVEVYRDGEKIA